MRSESLSFRNLRSTTLSRLPTVCRIDPLAWLVRHIPETVVFELDEDGNPIKGSDKPPEIPSTAPGGLVIVEDDEGKAKREEEQRRLAERQM